MFDLAGLLDIHLDARSGAVQIASSRPLAAAQVFVGKTPDEVVRQLPTLFSLCGTAQAAACVAACERALGQQPSPALVVRRAVLVEAETVKEHLWRLLMDWPRVLESAVTGDRTHPPDRFARQVAPSAGSGLVPAPGAAAAATLAAAPNTPSMPVVLRTYMALRQAQRAAGDPFALDAAEAERGASAPLDASLLSGVAVDCALGAAPADWLVGVEDVDAFWGWAERAQTSVAGLVRAVFSAGLASSGANQVPRLPILSQPWPQEGWPHRSEASSAPEACASTLLLEQWLAQQLATADAGVFIAAPQWKRQCVETGPLARAADHPLVDTLLAEYGNGLLARLAALLVDLAQSAVRLEAPAGAECTLAEATAVAATRSRQVEHSAGQCVGLGLTEAARGLLVHRAKVAGGRIEQYQILAPTEWNFHPEGVVAKGLSAIARSGVEAPELERLARLYITAVDPCVDYRLSVC